MQEMYVNLPPPQRRPQPRAVDQLDQASYSLNNKSRHVHPNGHDRIVMAPAPAPNYENIQRRHHSANHSTQSSISSAALDAIEPFNPPTPSSRSKSNSLDTSLPEYENIKSPIQKLSPEKFDMLMGNKQIKTRELVNFEELGLPIDEIKEISIKMAQEKKDEAFARQLQELEKGGVAVSQEEKDRMLAIEAQDKELAKMLQDRVSEYSNIVIQIFIFIIIF